MQFKKLYIVVIYFILCLSYIITISCLGGEATPVSRSYSADEGLARSQETDTVQNSTESMCVCMYLLEKACARVFFSYIVLLYLYFVYSYIYMYFGLIWMVYIIKYLNIEVAVVH